MRSTLAALLLLLVLPLGSALAAGTMTVTFVGCSLDGLLAALLGPLWAQTSVSVAADVSVTSSSTASGASSGSVVWDGAVTEVDGSGLDLLDVGGETSGSVPTPTPVPSPVTLGSLAAATLGTGPVDMAAAASVLDPSRTCPSGVDPMAEWARLVLVPAAVGVPSLQVRPGDLAGAAAAFRELLNHVRAGSSASSIAVPEVEERLTRIADFLAERAAAPAIDPRRVVAVCFALSQIGQVRSSERGERDAATGRWQRAGWERLAEYFRVAFDGLSPALEASIRWNDAPKPPSWCGIFCWWALKEAGYPLPAWPTGKGIYGSVPSRPGPKTATVPGDIMFHTGDAGHMALTVSTRDGVLRTVDGNTNSSSSPAGGQVGYKDPKSWERIHSAFAPARDF